jgi:hypothetical protein
MTIVEETVEGGMISSSTDVRLPSLALASKPSIN